jgi:hypothetical protein
MKLALLALTYLVVVSLVAPANTSPPTPRDVPRPERPASCGAPLALSDVVPNPSPGEAERLTVVNRGTVPIDLEDWALLAGRRRRPIGKTHLGPGQARIFAGAALGTLRLRNHAGEVRLVDPCGAVRAAVSWDTPGRGDTLEARAGPP